MSLFSGQTCHQQSPGSQRDVVIPKLEGCMEIFVKKLREGVNPDQKIFIDTLRERQPEDTIEKFLANKEFAGKFNIKITSFSSNNGKR